MFHNVLMTTLTPMRDSNEARSWDNNAFSTVWPELKQEKLKDTNIKKTIKKRKRNRTMFTTEQVRVLEKLFSRSKYIDVERRREISECLQIEQKCIKIWFQNRRMKEKKELSENCDSTSESVVDSISPPPEPQLSKIESDDDYIPNVQNHVKPTQYYYHASDYSKAEIHPHDPNRYETAKNPIYSDYFNYNYNNSNLLRNTDYSAQYYSPQSDFQYYYNTAVNNQYTTPNFQDWPANTFDTSYL